MNDLTYGQLKKRILDCLFEHEVGGGEIVHHDDGKNLVTARMADTTNSCLLRMYESFPFSRKKARFFLEADKYREGYVSAQLPDDFYRFDDAALSDLPEWEFFTSEGRVYLSERICPASCTAEFYYRTLPPKVYGDTADEFAFDLSPLCFEVLVCMCAMELCPTQESSLYTRLYYKYGDLCRGLSEPAPEARRNSFYHAVTKKRWFK